MLGQLAHQAEEYKGRRPLADKKSVLITPLPLQKEGHQNGTASGPKKGINRELGGLALDHTCRVPGLPHLFKSSNHSILYYARPS